MPTLPKSPCSIRTCKNHSFREGLCQTHYAQKQQQYDQQRGTSTERGYGSEWRRIRDRVLKDNPYCAQCGDISTDVHHIISKRKGGTDDLSNLVALCHSHHSMYSRRGE